MAPLAGPADGQLPGSDLGVSWGGFRNTDVGEVWGVGGVESIGFGVLRA